MHVINTFLFFTCGSTKAPQLDVRQLLPLTTSFANMQLIIPVPHCRSP